LSRSTNLKSRRNEAGFTLIEALVALAVVAVSITAIGSVVATNIRGTAALGQRLVLVETTRAILTGRQQSGSSVAALNRAVQLFAGALRLAPKRPART
jgi:general secretion pathway protein I